MHKNIHFRFNWCVASHLCSTQINSKSSKSRKFVCYEPLLKFPEHQFLCSVSVRGPRASRAPSMLGSFPGLVGCGRIANWLRSQLPPDLQSKARTIIQSYNGILDEPSRQETLDLLRSGDCRIVVCTDAFGLGMNIKAIPRVVLWKLNSKLGIDGFYQRIGRAGRD